MKILQNDIFASPKCRTSRMISPQISTITATDEYLECRIHEISEAVIERKKLINKVHSFGQICDGTYSKSINFQ